MNKISITSPKQNKTSPKPKKKKTPVKKVVEVVSSLPRTPSPIPASPPALAGSPDPMMTGGLKCPGSPLVASGKRHAPAPLVSPLPSFRRDDSSSLIASLSLELIRTNRELSTLKEEMVQEVPSLGQTLSKSESRKLNFLKQLRKKKCGIERAEFNQSRELSR